MRTVYFAILAKVCVLVLDRDRLIPQLQPCCCPRRRLELRHIVSIKHGCEGSLKKGPRYRHVVLRHFQLGQRLGKVSCLLRFGSLLTVEFNWQLGGLLRTYVLDSAWLLLPECLRETKEKHDLEFTGVCIIILLVVSY